MPEHGIIPVHVLDSYKGRRGRRAYPELPFLQSPKAFHRRRLHTGQEVVGLHTQQEFSLVPLTSTRSDLLWICSSMEHLLPCDGAGGCAEVDCWRDGLGVLERLGRLPAEYFRHLKNQPNLMVCSNQKRGN